MNPRRCLALGATVSLLGALVGGGVGAAPARASEVTPAQLRFLAARASDGSPDALAQLRDVTSVGGQPTALGVLLRSGTPAEIRARVVALAPSTPAPAVSADVARATADSILRQPRYGSATAPDPLGSLLRKLAHAVSGVASFTLGGALGFWALAALVVITVSLLAARWALRRRGAAGDVVSGPEQQRVQDAAALERAAQAAEARGAFSDAVRLRFRAGLLALGERSAIDYRPSLLTAEIARRLQSSQFDALARTFERVTYGAVPARPADAAAAREGWTSLLSRGSQR